jgi:hypothetical protein
VSADPLGNLLEHPSNKKRLLEEIEERKWDRILATPESIAYHERMCAEIEKDKAAGRLIEYVPGKSLEGLFQC